MAYSATCINIDCPEVGIVKVGIGVPLPDVEIKCGHCGEVCTIELDVPEPPPPPPSLLEVRVAELEQFNAELVTALQSVFDPASAATAASLSDLLPKKGTE